MPNETLLDQARTLSSGTMATISGLRKYAEVEKLQFKFEKFCETLTPYMQWQTAWKLFIQNEVV